MFTSNHNPGPAIEPQAQAVLDALVSAEKAGDKKPETVKESPVMQLPPVPEVVDSVLVSILSTKRQHLSASEKDFVEIWLCSAINNLGYAPVRKANNVIAVVPPPGKDTMPSTLFSCHTDTMHRSAGTQQIVYDPNFGHISLADPKKDECLGADDGVGVWIMLKMIEAKVPGVYVFHRGEELGCIGSKAMVSGFKDWLEEFSAAVAFDRPKDWEVITHQRGHRCASDTYGGALAKALNDLSGGVFQYKTSDKGVYTDTAEYAHLIPECINLGVGYLNQHSSSEYLDYGHAELLMRTLIQVDWEALPVERKPEAKPTYGYQGGGYTGYSGYRRDSWKGQRSFDDLDFTDPGNFDRRGSSNTGGRNVTTPSELERLRQAFQGQQQNRGNKKNKKKQQAQTYKEPSLVEEMMAMDYDQIADFIESDPVAAAGVMVELMAELAGANSRYDQLRRMWLST